LLLQHYFYCMSLGKFFKSKIFFIHLGLSFALTIVVFWLVTLCLGFITKHGKDITVPDLTGIKMEELDKYLGDKNLEYEIIDSSYSTADKKGTVISQDPYPNSKVKSGRKIYITVVAKLPERTTVPNLKDLTLRQTISVLETYGLKVGKLEYVEDIAKNAVIKQKYKGSEIAAGTMVEKGFSIDLVLGKGEKDEKAIVPFLLGKTRDAAIRLINEYSLNVGKEIFEDVADTSNACVYKQSPFFTTKPSVSLGTSVNLTYKSAKKFDFKTFLKKYKNDTIEDEK
jgi:eukaryotic-like serine/threonine-protein kinase